MSRAATARRTVLFYFCFLGLVQLAACAPREASTPAIVVTSQTSFPTRSVLPTPSLQANAPASPQPGATPIAPDSGWSHLRAGMEQRVLNVTGDGDEWLETVTILRLEPQQFRFDVLYNPGEPQSLPAWQTQSGALLVINGGFFTEENNATGLVISNGQSFGSSYEGFGGMFAVTESGPLLRWLPEQPYDAGEPLLAALQSFPMLLTPGGVSGVPSDDGQRARRTVVAQDDQGRLLFLVAPIGHFTLYGLSRYLETSDLSLDRALNLDGGASSGMILSEPPLYIPAFELLPTVIVVYEN